MAVQLPKSLTSFVGEALAVEQTIKASRKTLEARNISSYEVERIKAIDTAIDALHKFADDNTFSLGFGYTTSLNTLKEHLEEIVRQTHAILPEKLAKNDDTRVLLTCLKQAANLIVDDENRLTQKVQAVEAFLNQPQQQEQAIAQVDEEGLTDTEDDDELFFDAQIGPDKYFTDNIHPATTVPTHVVEPQKRAEILKAFNVASIDFNRHLTELKTKADKASDASKKARYTQAVDEGRRLLTDLEAVRDTFQKTGHWTEFKAEVIQKLADFEKTNTFHESYRSQTLRRYIIEPLERLCYKLYTAFNSNDISMQNKMSFFKTPTEAAHDKYQDKMQDVLKRHEPKSNQ